MKIPSFFILSNMLFTATIMAAPGTIARRARIARQTHPMIPVAPANASGHALEAGVFHVQYSDNWAGAVLENPPSGQHFTSVTGTFTIPTPKAPSGSSSSGSYSASAWVGIDGDTCTTAILQTGIDFTVTSGRVSYDAWYEWYPDYAYDFSGISIAAGNVIKLTVTATSTTSGTAVIQNLSTGKSVTHTFTSQSGTLCQTNAEWIVEDYENNGGLVPFANFGTVTFSGASAGTGSGSEGISGATVLDIQQGSTVYTSVDVESSSSVQISYV